MKPDRRYPATISECRLIELPQHPAMGLGTLTVAENGTGLPFDIRRVFYIYDVPAGAERGGHAHHSMQEMLVAVSGCFDVEITDGHERRTFTLRRPSQALYLPAGIWRSLSNFSSGCVVVTLCDTDYDETDYIRNFDEYLNLQLVR